MSSASIIMFLDRLYEFEIYRLSLPVSLNSSAMTDQRILMQIVSAAKLDIVSIPFIASNRGTRHQSRVRILDGTVPVPK